MIHYDTFVEDNWVVSMVWGEKNSVVEALLLQCWLQEMAPAQCLLFPQGFCCAFSMTGIREIWSPDNRLYGFIIHSQNSSYSVTEPAHILMSYRTGRIDGYT